MAQITLTDYCRGPGEKFALASKKDWQRGGL